MRILNVVIICWLVLALGVAIGNATFHPPFYFEYRYMQKEIYKCESEGYQFSVHGNTATCDETKNIWTIIVNKELTDFTK
jgi:hypothetical protein